MTTPAPPTAAAAPPSHGGFTLLELLVAVAVFAVVSIMAFGGMWSVMDTAAAARTHADRLQTLQRAFNLLGRDLEQAVPRGVRDSLGDPQPALRGGTGEVLVELTRGGAGSLVPGPDSALRRVAYRVVDERLERLRWPVLDRTPGMEPAVDTVIEGVAGHGVRFLTSDGWSAFWPPSPQAGGPAALPRAVELSVTLTDWGTIRRLYRVAG